MKHRLATLIAIWCAAASSPPSRPMSSAVTMNKLPSIITVTPIGRPVASRLRSIGPARAFEMREQAQRCESLRTPQVDEERDRLRPHHRGRREPEPARAEFRQSADAPRQRVAHRHQHDQAAEAEHHRRQRPMQAVAEIAHAQVQRQRGHAPADAVQERDRARPDFRRDAHRFQRDGTTLRKTNSTHAQHRRQPQRLAEQRARSRRDAPHRRVARPTAGRPSASPSAPSSAARTRPCPRRRPRACACRGGRRSRCRRNRSGRSTDGRGRGARRGLRWCAVPARTGAGGTSQGLDREGRRGDFRAPRTILAARRGSLMGSEMTNNSAAAPQADVPELRRAPARRALPRLRPAREGAGAPLQQHHRRLPGQRLQHRRAGVPHAVAVVRQARLFDAGVLRRPSHPLCQPGAPVRLPEHRDVLRGAVVGRLQRHEGRLQRRRRRGDREGDHRGGGQCAPRRGGQGTREGQARNPGHAGRERGPGRGDGGDQHAGRPPHQDAGGGREGRPRPAAAGRDLGRGRRTTKTSPSTANRGIRSRTR